LPIDVPKRQFQPNVIVICVRWYLRFSLSLRELEEIMAERGLSVDHTTTVMQHNRCRSFYTGFTKCEHRNKAVFIDFSSA
jgi:transposase-like protein